MHRAFILPLIILFMAPAGTSRAQSFDHGELDRILKTHVKKGRVGYGRIKKSELPALDKYLVSVGSARLKGFARHEKLAFYLNAYNALVIKSVVDKLPLKSIKKVKGFFDKARHKVAGRSVTLNDLENKIIRPKFKDPRIHFALVCAARSCPPLMSRAFSGPTLGKDLSRLARRFINSGSGLSISGDVVKASQLFNWYRQDFVDAAGSVGRFLAKYRKADADLLVKDGLKISHLQYDWTLNGP